VRSSLKKALALGVPRSATPQGASLLIYHRIGGGSPDERDLRLDAFASQLDVLAEHDVVALDRAMDRLDADDQRPSVVLTFDDGFRDVYENAWPLLRQRRLPFTLYLATAYLGGTMRWEGSTAKADGAALTWDMVAEMVYSGLCTVGNHTHDHVPPESLVEEQLDRCSDLIEDRLGLRPRHFAYPWGVPVPAMEPALRARFRTACTGDLGRNGATVDRMRLRRLPVRRTDPTPFFAAKLRGLGAERAYKQVVRTAKAVGARA
jgi:peptidoglycan/xylan/chitin deacetylase (PgdA/CDA1 family)